MTPNIPAVLPKDTRKFSLKITTTVPAAATVEPPKPIRSIPIEYIGEGAERVKYTPGPTVTSARIYAYGFIMESY
jgi:hypothetical protein